MAAWNEVSVAKSEKRHEIVLSGAAFSKHIEENGIDTELFTITSLNFLELSRTCLVLLPDDISKLTGLTALSLHNNNLSDLPDAIGKLLKLKTFDVSNNKLVRFPDVSDLTLLESLNVSCNQLESFPSIEDLVHLHILDLSYNKLSDLPEGLCNDDLTLLTQIVINDNLIRELPAELADLPSLRNLNVDNNSLTEIPAEFGTAPKLKQLSIVGNKLSDKRLVRLGKDGNIKHILDYLRKSVVKKHKFEKDAAVKEKSKAREKARKSRKKNKKDNDEENVITNMMKVLHFKDGLTVQVTNDITNIRPYIVCCIVRNIDFHKSSSMYKRFITLQTKLHDTVCQSRQAATIATHDLLKVKAPLVYEARLPSNIMVVPLFKSKEISAEKLVAKLRQEAEEFRKEKKRNTISGIHKYLDLLKDKRQYVCLTDKDGVVISFPPITNCDLTKISADTTSLLIEVTSTVSLDTCKSIMQTLLTEMLEMGLGADEKRDQSDESSEDEGAAGGEGHDLAKGQTLTLEQVQILDTEGQMKVVYPSRVDLVSEAFKVQRQH